MEVPGATKSVASIAAVLGYECLGTAGLLMTVNWTGNNNLQPFGVGILIFLMIVQLGDVSGGHFNPAVSLAVYVKEAHKGVNRLGSNALMLVMILVS
mmetsp:Transcript_16817/g.25913  ORF Transcript_16817/g.25913 Transcript_16817/m.25913 type:complete len:97 (+) Transcript_16817:74-364(+)